MVAIKMNDNEQNHREWDYTTFSKGCICILEEL